MAGTRRFARCVGALAVLAVPWFRTATDAVQGMDAVALPANPMKSRRRAMLARFLFFDPPC